MSYQSLTGKKKKKKAADDSVEVVIVQETMGRLEVRYGRFGGTNGKLAGGIWNASLEDKFSILARASWRQCRSGDTM